MLSELRIRFAQTMMQATPPTPDNLGVGKVSRNCGSPRPHRDPPGFTLIELVVVISLLGIVLVYAVPRLQGDYMSHDTKKVSRWLMINIPGLKYKAIREKKIYSLHLDLDENKIWTVGEATAEKSESDSDENEENGEDSGKTDEKEIDDEAGDADEEAEAEPQNVYTFPDGVDIVDVEYPGADKISSGETEILFYPAGYSDPAIIHVEDKDDNRISFMVEPFLTKVKMIEEYIEFE